MKFKTFANQVRFIRQAVDAFIKDNEPIEVHRFEVTPVPTALTMTSTMPTADLFVALTEPRVVIAMWYEQVGDQQGGGPAAGSPWVEEG